MANREDDWDVNRYRHPAEPAHHWELKKEFMLSIKHMFPEEKVACLAQTLGNIEFMGCRYPRDVMEQMKELSANIVQEFREKRGSRIQRIFVSGSAAASSKVNRTNPSYNQSANKRNAEDNQSQAKRTKYGNFVSASDSTEETGKKFSEGFILPPIRQKKSPDRRVRIELEASSTELARMPGLDDEDRMEIESRRSFKMPVYQYEWTSERQLRFNFDFPLHNFIVVKLAYHEEDTPINILQRSAGFSKMPVHWDYRAAGANTCYVEISKHVVAEELGDTKQEARDNACRRAVEILSEKCYTVYIKNKFLSDGTEVDLIDVEDNTKVGGRKEALGSSNVGHKLLSLMGWSGGGLGKDGDGIAEPITAQTVFGREGLGASVGVGKNFRQKIQKIIQEYIASYSPYDLVFTTGFDNEQRKVMHEIARRHNLKSKSFGKGEDRHLTISRKFESKSLIEELVRRGGETEKYVLLPPKSFS